MEEKGAVWLQLATLEQRSQTRYPLPPTPCSPFTQAEGANPPNPKSLADSIHLFVQLPPQRPRPPHQLFILVLLHLQPPLPLHADGVHPAPPEPHALALRTLSYAATPPRWLWVHDARVRIVVHPVASLSDFVDELRIGGVLYPSCVWGEESVRLSRPRSLTYVDEHMSWLLRDVVPPGSALQLLCLVSIGLCFCCCILSRLRFDLRVRDRPGSWWGIEWPKLPRNLLNGQLDSIGYTEG